MARLTAEGNIKVYKVPTVADKTAPTAAEIGAGTDLTPYLPTTGVDITWTQNNASLPMLDESFVVSAVGTESAEIKLTGVRDPDADDFFEAFDRGENFYLVVSRFGAAQGPQTGPPAVAGSSVEVYPVQSHRPVPLKAAENEFQQAEVSLGVTDTPVLDATVGS
jgi:hypothetical protein